MLSMVILLPTGFGVLIWYSFRSNRARVADYHAEREQFDRAIEEFRAAITPLRESAP